MKGEVVIAEAEKLKCRIMLVHRVMKQDRDLMPSYDTLLYQYAGKVHQIFLDKPECVNDLCGRLQARVGAVKTRLGILSDNWSGDDMEYFEKQLGRYELLSDQLKMVELAIVGGKDD